MNYLDDFLKKKKFSNERPKGTDKTVKTGSVSFVRPYLALVPEKRPPIKSQTTASTVLTKLSKPANAQQRIDKLMAEFEPMLEAFLATGDELALHYCLLDLERNIKDAVTGRGW